MITIDIPGYKMIELEHLVLDYNGTLAFDGVMIAGVGHLLELLSKHLTVHVITADTFGKAKESLSQINCNLTILEPGSQDKAKEAYVLALGKESVIAIGNGLNDMLMLEQAALGIILIQKEGAATNLLGVSDILCNSVIDALEMLLNPLRIIATLRK